MFGLFNKKKKVAMQGLNAAALAVAVFAVLSDAEQPLNVEFGMDAAAYACALFSLSQDDSVLSAFLAASVSMMAVGDTYARLTSGCTHAPCLLKLAAAVLHPFNALALLIIDDEQSHQAKASKAP